MTLVCSCGGTCTKTEVPEFRFDGFAGMPVTLINVPLLVCLSCGGTTMHGADIEQALQRLTECFRDQTHPLTDSKNRFLRKQDQWQK